MSRTTVLWLASCPSTNDIAWEEGRKRDDDLLCISADAQTAGRGRHGRSWVSPPGKDLLFSVYLRPSRPLEPAGMVTAIGAVAICEAVEPLLASRPPKPGTRIPGPGTRDPALTIRWPNDVYAGERKLCGILAESRTDGPSADYVLGIGLNVGSQPEDWPAEVRPLATSLRALAGAELDRRALLAAVLDRVEARYAEAKAGTIAPIEEAWARRSALPGRRVRLLAGDETVEGTVEAAGLASGIALRLAGGALRRFQAEHVTRVEPLT